MGRFRGSVVAGALVAAVILVLPVAAWAAPPGSLDTGFHATGYRTLSVTGGVDRGDEAIIVGGKILISGAANADFMLLRLDASGDPDPGFGGGDGIVTMNFLGTEDEYGDIAILAGGKIAAVVPTQGTGRNQIGVARFTSAGVPDGSFGGGDGKLVIDLGKNSFPYAMVALASGKLLVVGEFNTTDNDSSFFLLRLNPNGTRDHAFGGGDGLVTTQFGSGYDGAWRVAIDTHDRIVLAGWAQEPDHVNYDIGVARYLADGTPDHGFSGDGRVMLQMVEHGDDYAYGLGLQGDKVVAGVHLQDSDRKQVGLVRFLPSGKLDTTFGGGDGEVVTPIPDPDGSMDLRDIGIDASGRIVALSGAADPEEFMLTRYSPSGRLDPGFGVDGFSEPTGFADPGEPASLAIGANGRIVAVGKSGTDVAVARWLG